MKFAFALLTALFVNSALAAEPTGNFPPKEQFVENKQFKENGQPAAAPAVNFTASKKEVEKKFSKLDEDVKKMCSDQMEVVRLVAEKSTVKVTTFKNFNAPVAGKFKHYDGYIAWTKDKAQPEAHLLIDTTSWDSGVEARDLRVMMHLLKSDKKANAVADLDMSYKGQDALQPGMRDTKGTLNLRGKKYDLMASNRTSKDGLNWVVKSNAPARLAANLPKGDLREIMKYCNHKALTSTVDLEWSLTFAPACK